MLEYGIGRKIIEFSKTLMDTLWILKSNLLYVSVCSVDSLWSSSKNDVFHVRDFLLVLLWLIVSWVMEPSVVVVKTLSFVEKRTSISAFVKLLNEPLKNWNAFVIIKTLNLMCSNSSWTLHLSQSHGDLFSKFNLLTQSEVIFELNINIINACS